MTRSSGKPKAKPWIPDLATKDGVALTLNALRWRKLGPGSLGQGTWKQTRLHYLRRLKLQLGTRGVVAETTLPKRSAPAECVEAELVSTWAGAQQEAGVDEIAMSRLTVVFFQKEGVDPVTTLSRLLRQLSWADHAYVVAA